MVFMSSDNVYGKRRSVQSPAHLLVAEVSVAGDRGFHDIRVGHHLGQVGENIKIYLRTVYKNTIPIYITYSDRNENTRKIASASDVA